MNYTNEIFTDRVRNKVEQQCNHSSKQQQKGSTFDILNEMSEYLTLVQLIYNLVSLSKAVTISGVWIFDAN